MCIRDSPYTGEPFKIVQEDMAILKAMDSDSLAAPGSYKVLLQTGDETLDYRQAEEKYADSDLIIEQGGDHSFTGFEKHLPAIFRFLD